MFALVLLSNSSRELDRIFTYKVPENLLETVKVGSRVIVPFGMGNNRIDGYVVALKESIDGNFRTKNIYQLLDDEVNLSTEQLEMIKYLKRTYLCTYYEALQVVIPPGTKLKKELYYVPAKKKIVKILKLNEAEVVEYVNKKKYVSEKEILEHLSNVDSKVLKKMVKNKWITEVPRFVRDANQLFRLVARRNFEHDEMEKILEKIPASYKSQRKVLEFFLENHIEEVSTLSQKLGVSRGVFDRLKELGIIEVERESKFRYPYEISEKNPAELELTKSQKSIVDDIMERWEIGDYQSLIKGITGSGKTYIYLELMKRFLILEKQSIILVPEIALTSQLVKKVMEYFGDQVAVLHSKLSIGERYDQFRGIMTGKYKIIIGARSGIFAPVSKLGLIVIDEEHESSYKSDSNPKYLTHDLARYLSKYHKGALVLGSATPSVESYYENIEGDGKLYKLTERFNNLELPETKIIDMRKELNSGNDGVFSRDLLKAMKDNLSKKEQTIIFINRKGYANFVSCKECGSVIKCPKCDIALVYHDYNNTGTCNYCDYRIHIPEICPTCESDNMSFVGLGTERVMNELKRLFTEARLERMDSVTTSKKNSVNEIVSKMENNEIDILVGTKMVAKGFNFENVTLVGVVAADMMLNFPDYKSSESTFQLITQVAGRAGRFGKKGMCILQTYEPDDYAIVTSKNHDYETFYKYEISMRRTFGYPPFKYIANILVISENDNGARNGISRIYNGLKKVVDSQNFVESIELYQPTPASIEKINNKYRWQVILKYSKLDQKKIRDIIKYVCISNRDKLIDDKKAYLSLDLNSISFL
jgi:primosomal protein N' (replication factor Y)